MSLGDSKVFAKAVEHLSKNDKRLGRVIRNHGEIKFKPEGEMFESLVESILSQQLASPAANAIIKRTRALYEDGNLVPNLVYLTPSKKLRSAGVSPQKIRYLKDLSERVVQKKLDLEALREKSDEEIIGALDEVLGVGPWTAHMILIFTLGRCDVLPVDDLGVKKSIQKLYSLPNLPKKEKIEDLARKWHPYCSVASLYFWRFLDENS